MQSYSLTVDKFLDYAAKWAPDREVVTAGVGGAVARTAYAPLRTRSNLMSGALAALGMRLGDRIGTLAWNTQHHLEMYYAASGAGLVCHTLNPRLAAVQIADMVNEAQDRVLAVATTLQPLLPRLLPLCPAVEHVVLLDGGAGEGVATGMANGPRVWAYETLLQTEGRTVPWGDFPEESPAGLCYTSGTTGRPKGVLYTHRSNYLHTLRALQPDVLGLSGRDTLLVAVPMFHANGWGLPFAAAATGSKLVLPGRDTDGASLAALMRAEGVTLAAGVQTVWLGVVDHLDATGGELPDLKRVIIGGSSCPDALIRRLEARLGAEVQTSWGMTELSPIGAITPPGAAPGEARTAGRPPMGLDLKLTDAAGATLSEQRGVVGHLKAKGASVLDRYYEAEAESLDAEGYFDTGDLASIDAQGFVTICGRAKDLIKSGGEWINPAEIEEIVGRHPAVGLVAVIGRPHPKWGERPILIVEARQGQAVEGDELLSMLKGVVANWQIPDTVIEVQAMPLAATGKIDKIKLRADYAEGEAVERRSAN